MARTQTYETFSSGTLGFTPRIVTTAIAYAGADVSTVTDAEGGATAISHPATWATKVVRPGTPASETTYSRLGTVDDAYGRIGSIKRTLGAAQIESTSAFSATYPIETTTVTEDKGGALERCRHVPAQSCRIVTKQRGRQQTEPMSPRYWVRRAQPIAPKHCASPSRRSKTGSSSAGRSAC